ncbi:histidine kinase [Comamonas sp. JC664]|uniref:sensor histidine kinase n=1 Tax=Comamonas sp. JC664 TaxID=2801917 RepID=UPI001749D852|nr:histidine kinase [Comamonas sp. JC664]MBL0695115.1 histidine kinase [Comamonas sp. JC664]GHG86262.1 histidine kinase [Comamonas sp. KCTC 72670]
MKSSHTRTWAYVACQLGGWGLYALINSALALMTPARTMPGSLAALWAFSLCGALITHLGRAVLPLRAWARLPVSQLTPRVLVTAVGMGLAQNVTLLGVSVFVLRLYTLEQASLGAFFVSGFVWTVLMTLWLLLYFTLHAVERARTVEVERWQLEAAAQAAELRFLKSQLQPHFLFNCLNSVRALISEDPARAQEVVTRLSTLLRYALSSRDRETVSLEQELQVVRDYLELEGVRLESRLRVREEVEPATLSVSVPAMLVQTLVENAIKHGVAQMPEGGEVAVSARLREGALLLEVSNSAAPASLPAEGSGVGLHNASERLRLLFGAEASLHLDRTLPALTTARVRIPLALS